MAPEQLEGAQTDPRTDIFAFGAVLHEMLTGRKAFEGKSSVSVMSAILKDTPQPVSQLQPVSPPELDRLIARCLAKNPDDRWQSAGDLCYELKALYGSGTQASGQKPASKASHSGGRRTISTLTAVLIAMTLAIVSGFVAWMLKPSGPAGKAQTARVAIPLPPGDAFGYVGIPAIAVSPDGSMLVYSAVRGNGKPQLYLRAMDSIEVKPIDGTDDARGPFFSPDGKWIGFFAQNKLKKIPTSGGAPQSLCDAGGSNGGTWGEDDFIYYAPYSTSGIFKTRATDGKCEELTKLDRSQGEVSHRAPQLLPGGKALLFTVWTGPGTDEKNLHVQELGTDKHRELVRGASSGRYVPSGHLLYSRAGALMVVALDLASLKTIGSPVPLAERALDIETASFSVSDSGTLAYLPASPRRNERRLVWVNSKGIADPLPVKTGAFFEPSISPDGRSAAVTIDGPVETISILEFSRYILTPFTSMSLGSSQGPVWTNDGKRLAYRGTRNGFRNVFWKFVEGDNNEQQLTKGNNNQTPGSFSPKDQQLAYSDIDLATGGDIWVLPLDESRKPIVFRNSSAFEIGPVISADGHWLAYTSVETGQREVYVLPFPGPGGKRYQISTDGGSEPVWSRKKGLELFYRNGNKMMSVDVSTLPDKPLSPQFLFEGKYETSDTGRPGYDVNEDGRFLMVQPLEPEQPATQINVVLHWFEELKRIAPRTGQ
jgi:serine/threonine-protein kinase